jgi:hypothetical protein
MYNSREVTRQIVGVIPMPTQKLTAKILAAAIEGFETQKRRIDEQIAEIRQMLDGDHSEPAATPKVPKGKRRTMSAAARERIAEAQRKRWADSKKSSEPASQPAASPETPKRKKRKLSAAGRRAIAEATKKRWAAFHAAKEGKPGLLKKVSAKKSARKIAKKTATRAAKNSGNRAVKPPAATAVITAQ